MCAKKNNKTTTAKKPAKAKPASKKTSALNAAVQVLVESGGSMTAQEMIETMAAKKLWESPAGKTPTATLYSAILREINTKGKESRFKKTEPGKFAATGATGKAKATTEEKPASKATKPKTAKGKGKKKSAEPATAAAIPTAHTDPRACRNSSASEPPHQPHARHGPTRGHFRRHGPREGTLPRRNRNLGERGETRPTDKLDPQQFGG